MYKMVSIILLSIIITSKNLTHGIWDFDREDEDVGAWNHQNVIYNNRLFILSLYLQYLYVNVVGDKQKKFTILRYIYLCNFLNFIKCI